MEVARSVSLMQLIITVVWSVYCVGLYEEELLKI